MMNEKKKSTRKTILRAASFLFILICLLDLSAQILSPGIFASGNKKQTTLSIYAEKKDTLDVIAVGNSDLYSSLSPRVFWKWYGFPAYVLGEPSQRLDQAYVLLEGVLEQQKPSLVILETDEIYGGAPSLVMKANNFLTRRISRLFPAIEYHTRWKELRLKNLLKRPASIARDPRRGFHYSKKVKPYKGGDYMGNSRDVEKIGMIEQYYLNKIISLCRRKKIHLLFMESPSANSWNMKKHNGVEQYARLHGVPFLDLNLRLKEMRFDWMKDTRDGGDHLNVYGARKVSRYVGRYIRNKFFLKDRRVFDDYAE